MVIKRFREKSAGQSAREFDELLGPHLPHLYQLAYRFCNNNPDAEDLVQDLVIKLIPRSEEMRGIEKLRPWLAKVLYRQFIDTYRQKTRSPLGLLNDAEDILLEQSAPDSDSPENQTEANLSQKRLQHALSSLNDDQRAVVLLHDVEGYTLAELETILGSPQGTLKSRLNRARTQLRQCLGNK